MHFKKYLNRWKQAVAAALLLQGTWLFAADDVNLELHEWSVWLAEPQGKQINAAADYPTAMPGLVDTERSRRRDNDKPKPAPISLMTLYGTPPDVVDVDLKINSGRPVSQWPRSEGKASRLRWLDLTLSKEITNRELIAQIPDTHWFHQARELEGLYIQLKKGGRAERFFAYDLELNAPLNVRLDGGPEQFKVANLGKQAIHDVLLMVPDKDGCRIGWLDTIAPTVGGAAGANPAGGAAQPAGTPAAQPTATVVRAVAANGVALQVAVAAPIAAPAAATPSTTTPAATPAGGQPAGAKESIADIALSAPLVTDSDEFKQKTDGELRRRLATTNLKPAEINLILSLYAQHFFATDEIHLVFRLSSEGIEDLTPLTVEPETTKIKRVALMIARKVDPRLREDVEKLVTELADASYQKREQAEKRLKELGTLATASLKEALKQKDLEVVMRAERLLLGQKEQLAAEQNADQ